MTGQGHVLLHFKQFGAVDGGHWVFLAVHGFLFQRSVQLGEGQRCGVGTQRLDPVHVDRVGDHAQLQAFDVRHLVDGAAAVGQVAKAQLIKAQSHQAFFFQSGVHFFAKSTVHHHIGFLAAGEHEGEVKHRKFTHLRGKDARVHRRHLQRAALQGRHVGLVAAQCTTGEDVDFDLAARVFLDDFLELLHALNDGVTRRILVGELDGFVLRRCHTHRRQSHGRDQGLDEYTFHEMSPKLK